MPNYEFRCKKCKRVTEQMLPISLCDDKDLAPVCCKKPMGRIMSPVRHSFLVPPNGRYYETLGDYAATESEFREKAAKIKQQQRKDFNLDG